MLGFRAEGFVLQGFKVGGLRFDPPMIVQGWLMLNPELVEARGKGWSPRRDP